MSVSLSVWNKIVWNTQSSSLWLAQVNLDSLSGLSYVSLRSL